MTALAKLITISIGFEFEPRDCWWGIYWTQRENRRHLYVCLVPCLPLHVSWVNGRFDWIKPVWEVRENADTPIAMTATVRRVNGTVPLSAAAMLAEHVLSLLKEHCTPKDWALLKEMVVVSCGVDKHVEQTDDVALKTEEQVAGRSTPTQYRNGARVRDCHGRVWRYVASLDTWRPELFAAGEFRHRSYGALLRDLGPLTDPDEV